MTNNYVIQFKNESVLFVTSDGTLGMVAEVLENGSIIRFNEGIFRTEAIEYILTMDAWNGIEADEDYQELEDDDVFAAMAEAFDAREVQMKLQDAKIEELAKTLFRKESFSVVTNWDEIPEGLKAIFIIKATQQLA